MTNKLLKLLFVFFFAISSCHAGGLSFGVATIKSFDKPVEVSLQKCKIKLAPYSIITLDISESNDELRAGDILIGQGLISTFSGDGTPHFRAGGTTLQPGKESDLVFIPPSFTSLYPSKLAYIDPDDLSGCLIFPKKDEEGLKSGKDGLLLYNGVILKVDKSSFKEVDDFSSKKNACLANFSSLPPDSLSVASDNISYKVMRSQRILCPYTMNRVLQQYGIPFRPDSISVSLDRENTFNRSITFSFPYGADKASAEVANQIQTGPRAAIRFELNSGYTVILAPDSSIVVEGTPSTSPVFLDAKKKPYTITELTLTSGSLLLWPPEEPANRQQTKDVLLAGKSPVHVKGNILFSSQVGESLFVSVKERGNRLLPVLLSLAGGESARKDASTEVGRQEINWLQYVTEPETAAGNPHNSKKVVSALKQLAVAREKTVPLFTLIPTLPSSTVDLFENFAMNVEGSSLEGDVQILAEGIPGRKYLKPVDLINFIPRDDHNKVKISDKSDKSPIMDIHFFNPLNAVDKDSNKVDPYHLFAYFSKNQKVSSKTKVIKASEVTKYKAVYDYGEVQYEEHPYKVICFVIFLAALSVYALATVPFKVAMAIWYLFGYIRGEPCPECNMPFEKEKLPPLPLDAHLAVTSRLAYYGVRIELSGIEKKVTEALNLAADINPKVCKATPVHVEGDCVWCLRCSKGYLRFKIMRHDEVAESGIHPLEHPGMLEFVRRWNGRL